MASGSGWQGSYNRTARARRSRYAKTKIVNGQSVRVYSSMPNGWRETQGALTAPKGYTWINNGKSRFSGEREQALLKDRPKVRGRLNRSKRYRQSYGLPF